MRRARILLIILNGNDYFGGLSLAKDKKTKIKNIGHLTFKAILESVILDSELKFEIKKEKINLTKDS